MQNVLTGSACTVTFDFIEGGVYTPADALSVSWTLRANDGSILTTQNVNNSEPIQHLEVPISSTHNTNALAFEYRTVTVNYTVNGAARQFEKTYRVTDWLPHRVTPADVRAFVGLEEDELPDADVDIDGAYFVLADMVGSAATLNAALNAGNHTATKAKRAVIAASLIPLLPSLRLRARQSQKSDTASASRFAGIDFSALELAAKTDVDTFVTLLEGTSGSPAPLAATYAGSDPVTGV